jgi:hypothetical protein
MERASRVAAGRRIGMRRDAKVTLFLLRGQKSAEDTRRICRCTAKSEVRLTQPETRTRTKRMGSAHDTLSPVVLSVVPRTVAHCETPAHCVVYIYDLISLPSSFNAPWDPSAWHRWNWSIALHNISPCWLVGWLSNLGTSWQPGVLGKICELSARAETCSCCKAVCMPVWFGLVWFGGLFFCVRAADSSKRSRLPSSISRGLGEPSTSRQLGCVAWSARENAGYKLGNSGRSALDVWLDASQGAE